jgi:hypothetical protein
MPLAIFDIPRKESLSFLLSLVTVFVISTTVLAQTTSFTYQGKLSDTGTPANGNYDFQFKLFDTATVGTGTQQGGIVSVSNVTVTGGIFLVQLDFGACATCFNGANRFLEIALKPSAGSIFTTLSPRQQITTTPYALKSSNATTADGLSVACVNCVTSSQIASVNGSSVTGTIPLASIPAGSGNYIQNTTSPQATSNFNISGTGTAVVFNATQYNIGGVRVLSVAGTNNTFAGSGTGSAITTGLQNSFFGASAGASTTSGNSNTFFGRAAGSANSTGSNNTFIGNSANAGSGNLSNATAIGSQAQVTQNNSLVLGSINGVNGATSDTKVGIGTTAPGAPLDVQVAAGQSLQFRQDSGLVPGINVKTTGGNAGIMRLRNSVEVWPSDDLTRAGRVDVRNTAGSPTVSLDGQTGNLVANNLPGVEFDVPADPFDPGTIFELGVDNTSTIKTISVEVPADGFLVVFGKVYAYEFTGQPTVGDLQLFDETSNLTFERGSYRLFNQTITLQGVLPVSAGSRTLSLKLKNTGHVDLAYLTNSGSLIAMFFPKRY